MLISSACADNPSNGHSVSGENEQTTFEGPDGPGAPEGNSGILIVYFSATGNTAELANYIHDRTGGDLVEIQPEIPFRARFELQHAEYAPASRARYKCAACRFAGNV